MRDAHTCSISGVHLIMTTIWLLSGELAHVIGEVVCSSRVHVPCRISGVRRSAAMVMTHHCGGGLLVIPFAIVVEAQEVLLVTTMTARRNVALNAT